MRITRLSSELATTAATAAAGAIACYGSLNNGISWGSAGPQPGVFPFAVGCLIIAGSAANAIMALRQADHGTFIDSARLRRFAAFAVPVIAFALISVWLGLYIGIGLYAFYATWIAAKFRLPVALACALLVVAVNFAIFEVIFKVPLLKGPVLNAFGIY